MAKPQHTAYQLQADFTNMNTDENTVTHTGPVALDTDCVSNGVIKASASWRFTKQAKAMVFIAPEDGYVSFGYDKAEKLLKECRKIGKEQFKKGQRPTFFLRKLTMSEFMDHKEFKKHKSANPIVRSVFKKYLLIDQLRDGGYQTS